MAIKPIFFATLQLAKLLKANRFTLNRLMLRCKIEPSFGSRSGRGSRLFFTVEDASKLALAYWLFRCGLRSPAIKGVLDDVQVADLLKALASPEEIEKVGTQVRFLVTWRIAARGKNAKQETKVEKDYAGVQRVLEGTHQYGFVVIPIGRLLRELAKAIRER
jgi:hypothetical protein